MGIPVIKIFRSFLLVILAYLSCQVLGYASMTVLIYTYDAGAYFHIDRNLNSDNQNYFYDGTANQYKPIGNLQGHSVDTKYQTTSFFTFVDGFVVTKSVRGLETRGVRPARGTRTIQGQVDAATQAGNPTVQRGGQDLFRLRSGGHGQAGATATPQNVFRTNPKTGERFGPQSDPDRTVTSRDIRELYKAQIRQGTSNVRTRSGR